MLLGKSFSASPVNCSTLSGCQSLLRNCSRGAEHYIYFHRGTDVVLAVFFDPAVTFDYVLSVSPAV